MKEFIVKNPSFMFGLVSALVICTLFWVTYFECVMNFGGFAEFVQNHPFADVLTIYTILPTFLTLFLGGVIGKEEFDELKEDKRRNKK
ncbi:hypothetical protein E5358_12735 [Palleniella muris]|uniref:Uncharacterized protein n=1 Tax=Palleniella muris TaxID=3038145 RepID=A0AC61QMM8_9BACT|nr:hypothetical protein [Palleniella muris]TGX80516.1 hypothetical protein E5358_12735 [Palleniella muris]